MNAQEAAEALARAYGEGGPSGSAEAHRAFGHTLLGLALSSDALTTGIASTLREAHQCLARGILTETQTEAYSDAIWSYIESKHGQAVVVRDHEDRVLRACYEAFNPTIEWDGIRSVSYDCAELLEGRGTGDITIDPDP